MDFAELTASCRREAGEPSPDALRRGRLLWDLGGAVRDVLRQHPSDLQALEALPDPGTWDPELPLPELHALRRRSMVSLAGFELSGELDLPAVADLQSQLADWVLDRALALARAQTGGADLAILALGKLGGNELNYSSDVDLVLVRADDVPLPAALRTARVLVDLLHRRTSTGGLYRVDLRLRPHGKLGPLAPTRSNVLSYTGKQARAWERQAWVKARAAAGDRELGARLLADLEPWLWGQELGAEDLGSLLALRERMAESSADPERDVKVGHGGIRDVEFAVQLSQLLHGGADPRLRVTATLDALTGLTDAHVLRVEEARVLEAGYLFHRRLEHLLQLRGDREVTVLPRGEGLRPLAAACELSPEALDAAFAQHQRTVRAALDTLIRRPFAEHKDPRAADLRDLLLRERPDPALVRQRLAERFADPEAAWSALRDLSRERSSLLAPSGRARVVLAGLLPTLLEAIGRHADPDRILNNLRAALEHLGAKATVYELWSEQPDALELLVALAAGSDVLSTLLARHPGVFDEVIDRLLTRAPVHAQDVLSEVRFALTSAAPGPGQLEVWALYQLQIGISDLGGRSNLQNTARQLAEVSSGFLEAWLQYALADTAGAHGGTPAGLQLALLSLGKLGGRELCYGSDVDLLAVYEAEGPAPDGTAPQVFCEAVLRKLLARAQAVAWGDAPPLELDFRLRPGGKSSPLAQSLEAVEGYYLARGAGPHAHDFERLALQKARAVAGSLELGQRAVDRVRRAIRGRDAAALGAEVERMRELQRRAAAEHDLKRGRGSLSDVELSTSALALLHLDPARDEPNTLRALHALQAAGALEAGAYLALSTGYAFLRRVELRLRVQRFDARPLLPLGHAKRRQLAHSLGYQDAAVPAEEAFLKELGYHRAQVAQRCEEIWRRMQRG